MSYKLEKITEPLALGEGPHWDERQQALFFVSIVQKTIHKYVPSTGDHTKTQLHGCPGFIVPVEGSVNEFVIGVDRQFELVQWDGSEGSEAKVLRVLAACDQHAPANRINDGKCDPRGRLFAGTMDFENGALGTVRPNKGSLYRLDGSKSQLKLVAEGITVANGLAWDLKEKAFYYIDSPERKVRRYDYDVDTGEISNKTYIFDFEASNIEGVPDGTTIDTDGNLWVAVFGGSCILKINPRTGTVLSKIPIPASQVTSATFGGPNYEILFVTTASLNIDAPQPPPCGATYMVTGLGVKGLPNVQFKL